LQGAGEDGVLGRVSSDDRDARRRIPTATMTERASISRDTLHKVEQGHPGVQIGIYATVLFVLGLANRIGELADNVSRHCLAVKSAATTTALFAVSHSCREKPVASDSPERLCFS
jgi:hypothetical protein